MVSMQDATLAPIWAVFDYAWGAPEQNGDIRDPEDADPDSPPPPGLLPDLLMLENGEDEGAEAVPTTPEDRDGVRKDLDEVFEGVQDEPPQPEPSQPEPSLSINPPDLPLGVNIYTMGSQFETGNEDSQCSQPQLGLASSSSVGPDEIPAAQPSADTEAQAKRQVYIQERMSAIRLVRPLLFQCWPGRREVSSNNMKRAKSSSCLGRSWAASWKLHHVGYLRCQHGQPPDFAVSV